MRWAVASVGTNWHVVSANRDGLRDDYRAGFGKDKWPAAVDEEHSAMVVRAVMGTMLKFCRSPPEEREHNPLRDEVPPADDLVRAEVVKA